MDKIMVVIMHRLLYIMMHRLRQYDVLLCKMMSSAFLRMNSNLYINHGESRVYHQDAVLHIINSAGIVYHHCESVIQPAADEIHALRDDMRLAAMIYHCFGNG